MYCAICQRAHSDPTLRFCPQDGSRLIDRPEGLLTDPLIGALVDDRFRVEACIGNGGFGDVYRATDGARFDMPVALKVLNTAGSRSGESVERFKLEARLMARLRHTNVVRFVGHGLVPDGRLYLATELLEGHELADLLIHKTMSPGLMLELARQVLSALVHIHAHGLIHRDLKPHNIFVVEQAGGRIYKILDFGISKTAGEALTQSGVVLGTPQYMAPEQFIGEPVDARTDLYALGCVLYWALTGRVPLTGKTPLETMRLRDAEEPQSTQAPRAINNLVMSLLARDPAARPESAAQTLQWVESLIDRPPVETMGRAATSAVDETQTGRYEPSGPAPALPVSEVASRGPRLAIVLPIAALLVLALAAVVWIAWPPTSASAPAPASPPMSTATAATTRAVRDEPSSSRSAESPVAPKPSPEAQPKAPPASVEAATPATPTAPVGPSVGGAPTVDAGTSLPFDGKARRPATKARPKRRRVAPPVHEQLPF